MKIPRQYCPRCNDLKPKGYGRTTCDICFDEVIDETEEDAQERENDEAESQGEADARHSYELDKD